MHPSGSDRPCASLTRRGARVAGAKRWAIAAGAMCGLAIFELAPVPTDRQPPASQTSVRGCVSVDGKPAPGAEVVEDRSRASDIVRGERVAVDGDGCFALPVHPGSFRLEVTAGGPAHTASFDVLARDGQVIDLGMLRLGRRLVAGVVRDRAGTPVPHVIVLDDHGTAMATTGDDGRYQLTLGSAGHHALRAFDNAGHWARVDIEVVAFDGPSEARDITLR